MQENVFNNIASYYDEVLPSHISRHYLEKRVSFFSRYLKPNSKILDVGCGTGKLIINLPCNNKLGIYGCDNSIGMLKNVPTKSKAHITCCASDGLSYMVNTFDVVVSVAVFHHLYSESVALQTIREMIRVAKKGGKVIIWDANFLNPYWRFLFKRIPYDKYAKNVISLSRIIREAKKNNLTDIKVVKSGWIPDFAPKKLRSLFNFFEYIMEHIPVIKLFSAHNIVIFTK